MRTCARRQWRCIILLEAGLVAREGLLGLVCPQGAGLFGGRAGWLAECAASARALLGAHMAPRLYMLLDGAHVNIVPHYYHTPGLSVLASQRVGVMGWRGATGGGHQPAVTPTGAGCMARCVNAMHGTLQGHSGSNRGPWWLFPLSHVTNGQPKPCSEEVATWHAHRAGQEHVSQVAW